MADKELEKAASVVTVKETASLLGLNIHTIYRLLKRGKLPQLNLCGKILIPRSHVERMIEGVRTA